MIRASRFIRELTARRAGYRAAQYRIAHEWADLPLYAEPFAMTYYVYQYVGTEPGNCTVGYVDEESDEHKHVVHAGPLTIQ